MSDRTLASELDALPEGEGTVTIDRPGSSADVDVVDVDRLGVRIREVRIDRDKAVDIEAEAAALPDRIRALPDRVAPVEVAPDLGGARLRTKPEELRGEEFFEVEVAPQRTTIRRTRVAEDNARSPSDWTMTRDQLDRLIDEAAGTKPEP